MSGRKYRLLFCVPTTALSGGVKVIFEIATGLAARGHDVHLFSFAGNPEWYDLKVALVPQKNFEQLDAAAFDFIVVSNAFMLPMLLPSVAPARPLFFTQDYEPFHHAGGGTQYEDFICDDETLLSIYRLPVPIFTQAQAVQRLIEERARREVAFVPLGIDKKTFAPRPPHTRGERDRVLMVGNYLMPYKGMRDGFEALRIVNRSHPVELVLATQESRNRQLLDGYDYPIEIHHRPMEREMPEIYGSADLYCCTSWYEGFGLPAIEAFGCGVPVVSTRTFGVNDYGIDGTNLLLCNPNDPEDLASKTLRALQDDVLRERLRANGFATLEGRYEWPLSIDVFEAALAAADRDYPTPPAVDAEEMRQLLVRMEESGNLTPIAVFRRYGQLEKRVEQLLVELKQPQAGGAALSELCVVRDELREFLGNERAQYHCAFRSLFDLCQIVVSNEGNAQIAALLRQRINATPNAAPSFPAHA